MGLAFLITSENLQILSERKVLKESEYAALLDANAIIGTAQKERERILQEAQRNYQQNEQRGYRDGVARGEREYAEKAFASSFDAAHRLQAMKDVMADLVARAITQLVDDIEPRQLLAAALRRIDALVRDEPFVVLRVSPSQEATVRQVLSQLWQRGDAAQTVKVVPDASLSDTSCIAQTSAGVIDASLDTQLAALRRAIANQEAPHERT